MIIVPGRTPPSNATRSRAWAAGARPTSMAAARTAHPLCLNIPEVLFRNLCRDIHGQDLRSGWRRWWPNCEWAPFAPVRRADWQDGEFLVTGLNRSDVDAGLLREVRSAVRYRPSRRAMKASFSNRLTSCSFL